MDTLLVKYNEAAPFDVCKINQFALFSLHSDIMYFSDRDSAMSYGNNNLGMGNFLIRKINSYDCQINENVDVQELISL